MIGCCYNKLYKYQPIYLDGNNMIYITQIHCPLGNLVAAADLTGLIRLDFLDEQLDATELLKWVSKYIKTDAISLGEFELFKDLKNELGLYFLGKRKQFKTPLNIRGTTFQLQVWQELLKIPYGTTISYGELARRVGRTDVGQSRAVANANARNPIAILVPCHRVVGADGSLTGYAGGIWRKQALLVLEGARLV